MHIGLPVSEFILRFISIGNSPRKGVSNLSASFYTFPLENISCLSPQLLQIK